MADESSFTPAGFLSNATAEFVGKMVKVEYVQELGWRRPHNVQFEQESYQVTQVISRWEEHTLGKPWWSRKHRVWYLVELSDGGFFEIYWDRGARGKGKDWVLVKRYSGTPDVP